MEFRDGIYQLYDLQVLLNLLNDIPVRSQGIVQGEGTTNFFLPLQSMLTGTCDISQLKFTQMTQGLCYSFRLNVINEIQHNKSR